MNQLTSLMLYTGAASLLWMYDVPWYINLCTLWLAGTAGYLASTSLRRQRL